MRLDTISKIPAWFAWAIIIALSAGSTAGQDAPRAMYVISDLHFNVGRVDGKDWHALEDFRWPNALDGFLRHLETLHPKGVDLIVAGDFLELWQHPTVNCAKAGDAECGCTIEEMKRIVRDVLRAHETELMSMSRFLNRTQNRIVVVPGNHDAALMVDEIWSLLKEALPSGRDRFMRADSGTWISADGRVAAEHGHQQGFDVNSFPDWDTRRSVTKECSGTTRFFRPWGENFVQSLYNEVEARFPLIDNLIPESAGVAIYWKYAGLAGRRAEDLARFISFNILQTSFYQKGAALRIAGETTALSSDDVSRCRKCLREELILRSDPESRALVLREEAILRASGKGGGSSLREALAKNVESMDDASIQMLCERAALQNDGQLSFPARSGVSECKGELATAFSRIFDPDGAGILADRVRSIRKTNPLLSVYVFGHSHEARDRMSVRVGNDEVSAFNTGAFQRLIDEKRLLQKKRENESEVELLSRLRHEDLASCYATVAITYAGQFPKAELKQWYMPEQATTGELLDGCTMRCSAPPANCKKLVR